MSKRKASIDQVANVKDHAVATRLAAALALTDVLGAGRALDAALLQRCAALADPRDRALAQEIAYGVLRVLPALRQIAAGLLQCAIKPRDLDVECLLWVGLYQLNALRVPSYAAVSQTVAATRGLNKSWASGFLNAVLRRAAQHLSPDIVEPDHHCFPDWLANRLQQAWPEEAQRVMHESNQRPPMSLRVNLTRLSRADYAEQLAAIGLSARPLKHTPAALVLDQPVGVAQLPGFAEGWISVQDGAAQLAAPLLAARPGDELLDACAAPGGKTAHLLETCPRALVTAVDINPERLQSVRDALVRLHLNARIVAADLADAAGGTAPWADRYYDSILLDVPCSATGVIRRHPDIKWLRRPTDIAALVATQRRILDRVWPQLRPGGTLLYVTCSLLPEENQQQIQSFLEQTPDAQEQPLAVSWGRACSVGRQILTGDERMDGFYFARLVRLGGGGVIS